MTEHTLADENDADVSAAFDLLSNARRRGVLYAVSRDGSATVAELAERIAAWQDGHHSPEEVRTSLVHAHLPKLADAGVVDYDHDQGVVEPTEDADDLEPYLEKTAESESTRSATVGLSSLNA